MRKNRAFKVAACVATTALVLLIPTTIAKAEDLIGPEQGIAGISTSFDNYYQGNGAKASDKTLIKLMETEILSPFKDKGISIADNYVNVRSEPSTESEVVGKLYRGCEADILERLEGDWVKIKSGDVQGYIASNFLVTGFDVESMIEKYATKYITVDTQTLRVREEKNTDSKILTLIPQGETYIVKKEYDDWVEIVLGADEDTGNDFTGFVSKDFVNITVEFEHAISIEEENRIKKAQEEAERAERERKEKLAEEAARRAEEERKAQEAKNNNSQQPAKSSQSSSSGNSDAASLRNEIVNYALKFVGNRYVWGGVSLTNGADCSGFVKAVYEDFGYYLPRVSRDQAASAGKRISLSERQPGDLIFYANSSGTVNHVAMYIGNDRIVQAANSRQGIITSKYNYRDIYCIRRIIY